MESPVQLRSKPINPPRTPPSPSPMPIHNRSHSRSHTPYKGRRRSHRRTPSRSRSPSPRRYSRSRSRSYSRNRRNYDRRRSYSRSPSDRHRKYDKPPQCRCIGIFGLSHSTTKDKIIKVFGRYGPIDRVNMIIDKETGCSRGFCFVYFENLADAIVAKEQCSGQTIDNKRMRVDYSVTHRAHSPTPGIYKGQPRYKHDSEDLDYRRRGNGYHDDYHRSSRRRSPSRERYRRHLNRSRSRSISPRDRRYR